MIRLRPSGADEVLIKRVRDWYEPGPGVFIAPQALFNPALLFTTGVNGTWYDPSDLNTLFQDAAGTTPVTAVEQPVGLMLDKSKGLVLGPELVTNGDFSQGATGWTIGTGWSISGGQANAVGVVAGQNLQSVGLCVSGKTYLISYTLSNVSAGGISINLGVSGVGRTANGAYTEILTATASTNIVFVRRFSDFTGTIDNISVRELPGNHAFNSSGNSANFPVLSARYNLLTKTEDFSDAVWNKPTVTVTANAIVAPDGKLAADKTAASNTSNVIHQAYQVGITLITNSPCRYSCYMKAGEYSWGVIDVYDVTLGDRRCYFDLMNGVLGTMASGCSGNITSVGGGWYLCSVTATPGGTSGGISVEFSNADNLASFAATSGGGIYIWGADMRYANDALNQPAYQRVNTATDYDTVGFKPYLKFNGTNQWLQTNSIDFSYGDKMFVCAGVRKLSDAAIGALLETSANSNLNNGAIWLLCPGSPALDQYSFRSKGTSASDVNVTGYAAPITNVLSGIGNISGDQAILRVNGAQAAISTGDQGTGNYGNYPLYIGARAGSSLWFNGRLHQLVVAGKQASASEIGQTEAFTNQKTGAY